MHYDLTLVQKTMLYNLPNPCRICPASKILTVAVIVPPRRRPRRTMQNTSGAAGTPSSGMIPGGRRTSRGRWARRPVRRRTRHDPPRSTWYMASYRQLEGIMSGTAAQITTLFRLDCLMAGTDPNSYRYAKINALRYRLHV